MAAESNVNTAERARPEARPFTLRRRDDLLTRDEQKRILNLLMEPGWRFGWKSNLKTDVFSFWHKHFAGTKDPDYDRRDPLTPAYTADCSHELLRGAPLIHEFWDSLNRTFLHGHRLVRCYANALSFGSEGTLHTDSTSPGSFTTLYYPHFEWAPNWGGETVFFTPDKTDILTAVYPKPNRLITFPGTLPHVARGVSRSCPTIRITLMFKTEVDVDRPAA